MAEQLLQYSFALDEITNAATKLISSIGEARVFAFSGDMGAGKTTFIRALCHVLKVNDNVSSPTFALINEYHFTNAAGEDRVVYHMDWYRLKDAEEAVNAGVEDCLLRAADTGAYCFIEWPEKAIDLLDPPYVRITIGEGDTNQRLLTATLIGD